ncbi:MAG: hypothetical protein AAFX90_19430 [Pseudomonadota bacterium]
MADFLVERSERVSNANQFDGVSTTFGPFGFEIFDVLDVVAETREIGTSTWFLDGTATFAKGAATPDTFSVTFNQVYPNTHEFRVRGKRTHERSISLARGTGLDLEALAMVQAQIAFVLQEMRRDVDTVDGTAAQQAASTAVTARDDALQAAQDAEDAKTVLETVSTVLTDLEAGTIAGPITFQATATFQDGLVFQGDDEQRTTLVIPTYYRFSNPAGSTELEINKPAAVGFLARIWGLWNGVSQWAVDLGDSSADNDFVIKRYDAAGNFLANALKIKRTNGQALLTGELTLSENDPIAWALGNTIKVGNGSPEGNVEANVGSLYLRRDGNASVGVLYVKQAGSGLTTGWVAK